MSAWNGRPTEHAGETDSKVTKENFMAHFNTWAFVQMLTSSELEFLLSYVPKVHWWSPIAPFYALFSSPKKQKFFKILRQYWILRHMHGALNIDDKQKCHFSKKFGN